MAPAPFALSLSKGMAPAPFALSLSKGVAHGRLPSPLPAHQAALTPPEHSMAMSTPL